MKLKNDPFVIGKSIEERPASVIAVLGINKRDTHDEED